MEYFARNDSKIVLAKSICEVVLPPRSAVVLFERAIRGVGGGEDLATSAWRSGLDSASDIARRCQQARSKTARCEVYAFRGLARVGTTPIHSGGCGRQQF